MDFTLKKYEILINVLKDKNYKFLSFEEYILNSNIIANDDLIVILRHDVDDRPENSLRMAKLENEIGVKGSYYFRAVPCSWDVKIIRSIENLGHEIGYHYETMDTANGNIDEAWESMLQQMQKEFKS